MREFKEAFGFFNAQNPRDTELSAHDVYDVMTKFDPHAEVDIKVSLAAREKSARHKSLVPSPRPAEPTRSGRGVLARPRSEHTGVLEAPLEARSW